VSHLLWTDARIRQNAYPNADSLAAEFEISRRQAFQDHAFLRDRLNAPIACSRTRRGWYYTDPTYALPAISLEVGESATESEGRHSLHAWSEPRY
jgi:predicted DNA-binding transcriptional regulator YafY